MRFCPGKVSGASVFEGFPHAGLGDLRTLAAEPNID
jgi:hypothetical protein